MALTPTIKNALNAMSTVDKALVVLYVCGVDNNALAAEIGDAFVHEFYPQHDPATLTNDQLALAMLLQTRRFVRDVYSANRSSEASETARVAAAAVAAAAVPYGNIGEL